MTYNEWIMQVKEDRPELADFINKLEPLISDSGFNSTKFESAVERGLKKVDADFSDEDKIIENA